MRKTEKKLGRVWKRETVCGERFENGRDVSSVLAVQPDALPRKEHIIWEPPMREETRSKHVEPSYHAAPKTRDKR